MDNYPLTVEEYYAVDPAVEENSHVKKGIVLIFFLVSIVISLLSDVRSNAGGMYVFCRYVLIALVFISLVAPSKWGVIIFFMLALLGPDRVQSTLEKLTYGEYSAASIWRIWLGPIRPSMLITGCIFIQVLKVGRLFLEDKCVKVALFWFISVPVITGFVYGGFSTPFRSFEVPADVRVGIILILTIILFQSYFRKYPESIGLFLAVFIGSILARHLCDFIYWLTGFGSIQAGFLRISVDATKGTIIFPLLFSLYLLAKRGKYVAGGLLFMMSTLLLIAYSGRLLWITAGLGVVLFLFIMGVKRAVILLPIIIILIFGSLKMALAYRAEMSLALKVRAQTFATESGGNYLQRLDPLRYGEIINSTNTNLKRLAIFWGSGYGSYYKDDVVAFPRQLKAAFSDYSAATGQFFSCHDYFIHTMFKHGIIGLIIISYLWLKPTWSSYKLYDRSDLGLSNGIFACLIVFAPLTMVQFYWSGKGLFISGVVIAMLLVITKNLRDQMAHEPGDFNQGEVFGKPQENTFE